MKLFKCALKFIDPLSQEVISKLKIIFEKNVVFFITHVLRFYYYFHIPFLTMASI